MQRRIKIRARKVLIACTAILLVFGHCGKSNQNSEAPPLSKEKFARLYARVLLIQNKNLPRKKTENKLRQLYQKYDLTREKYQKIESYYQSHPDKWIDILHKTEKIINQMAEKEKEK